MSSIIGERRINRDVGSPESFVRARSWLEECSEAGIKHDECRIVPQMKHGDIPARLLDVEDSNDCAFITLREMNPSEEVLWCSLSYCWGGDQSSKLTKSRLSEYLRQIPLHSLPATLRDAVVVTRQMGFRYLWVDSMCIIQDSDEDKAAELVKMPRIYGSSQLTISASSATTSNEGFLQIRNLPFGVTKTVRLRVALRNGSTGSILLAHREPPFTSYTEPTNMRAWCFQERMLSRRVIDFGTRQMRFVCRSKSFRDGGASSMADPGLDGTGGTGLWRENVAAAEVSDERVNRWTAIVNAYSLRKLKFAGDRLVALAGVSEEYASKYRLTFVAGMWKEDLHKYLCWSLPGTTSPVRAEEYVAPTWSWASTADHISFAHDTLGSIAYGVVSCTTRPVMESLPYSAVAAGTLVLRGQLKAAKWTYKRRRRENGHLYLDESVLVFNVNSQEMSFDRSRIRLESSEEHGTTLFLGFVKPDFMDENHLQEQEGSEQLWCMKLRNRSTKRGTMCLLLTFNEDGGTFQRRGLF